MYQVLYGNQTSFEASTDIGTLKNARKYAEERMKEPCVTEAVITKENLHTEGYTPIEYYGPNGHFVL